MTVQELIDKLQQVENKNIQVFIVNPICGFDDICFADFQSLKDYKLAENDAFVIEGLYTYTNETI